MAIDRYDRYREPRLAVVEDGAYLIRDVLTSDGKFSGICEYGVYDVWDGEVVWTVCREGVEFKDIRPFLPSRNIK